MDTQDDRPLGAPVLAPRRRDRVSIWIAERSWTVPAVRVVVGVSLLAAIALVSGANWPWREAAGFVIAALLGDRVVEREKARGDELALSPSAFEEDFAVLRASESDSRYLRRRY